MAQSSCRGSKGLWTDKNNWEKQATLIASAPCAAFARNGFIYKSSSKVLQDKLTLMLMSIMMGDQRYAMWSLSSLCPCEFWVICRSVPEQYAREKKEIWHDLLCGWKDALYLSLCLSPVLAFFFFYWEIKSMRWCSLRHAGLMMKERALLLSWECVRASNPATNTFFARSRTRAVLIWALML